MQCQLTTGVPWFATSSGADFRPAVVSLLYPGGTLQVGVSMGGNRCECASECQCPGGCSDLNQHIAQTLASGARATCSVCCQRQRRVLGAYTAQVSLFQHSHNVALLCVVSAHAQCGCSGRWAVRHQYVSQPGTKRAPGAGVPQTPPSRPQVAMKCWDGGVGGLWRAGRWKILSRGRGAALDAYGASCDV